MTANNKNSHSNEVELIMANNKLFPIKGKIETVESEIDKQTGNLAFRARFHNPNEILKQGSSGKIIIKQTLKKAMLIPQKSTFEIQDNIYVFVVDSDNIVHMKRIVPKLRMKNVYVVESGLNPNEKILLEGIQLVKEDDKILTQLIPSREAIKSIN
jgi:membrane fusion protein (multidrug efflux system)